MGGTIGLAISTTVLNSHVNGKLGKLLNQEEIQAIGQSLSAIGGLNEEQQVFVRRIFAEGYDKQMRVVSIFSGLVVLSSFLMIERRPRRHDV